jgi:hypothetical protein
MRLQAQTALIENRQTARTRLTLCRGDDKILAVDRLDEWLVPAEIINVIGSQAPATATACSGRAAANCSCSR